MPAEHRRIVIIGAGAAGLMAAAHAAQVARPNGGEVMVLEKNSKTGAKILMSGGTRCNITQDTDARGITSVFANGGRFLQKSIGAFSPSAVVQLFNQLGVETKVESTGKVFPKSNRALHVRDALERYAVESGAVIYRRSGVTGLSNHHGQWQVATESETIACGKVIVTSGGKSWPGCGTTGDAYAWLYQLGHTIRKTHPALVPLVGGQAWSHQLSGLTLDDCQAAVYSKDHWLNRPAKRRKPLSQRRGGWLFTHQGFSGPAAMDVSGAITGQSSFDDTVMTVDFLPQMAGSELESLLSNRSEQGRTTVSNQLAKVMPTRLASALTLHAAQDCALSQLKRQALQALISAIKCCVLPVLGTRGFEKAEVTAGGVQLKDVDAKTMQSKLHPGLYIAGEVLDVDGPIGGYNFQAAFSTGRAAGLHAAAE